MSDYLVSLLQNGLNDLFSEISFSIYKRHAHENKYILEKEVQAIEGDVFYVKYIVYDDDKASELGFDFTKQEDWAHEIDTYGDYVEL